MNRLMRSLVLAFSCIGMVMWSTVPGIAGTTLASAELAADDSFGPTISPALGGQATVFTINFKYGRFGKQPGQVLIGEKRCRVLSWSKTFIRAKIVKDLEVGVYDVTIVPVKGHRILIPYGFEVVWPRIITSGPIPVTAGSVQTISTINLPPRKGQAFMFVDGGALIPCPIRRWAPDAVKLEIPDTTPGVYDLLLTTEEGDLTANSLYEVQLRPPGQTWDYSWRYGWWMTTCTGIMYGGKVCRFGPSLNEKWSEEKNGILYDISDAPGDHGNEGRIVDSNGNAPATYGHVVPAVIGGRLYLFWPIREGGWFEYTWTDNVAVEKPVWAPLSRFEARHATRDSRPSVLHRADTKTTFIYYHTPNNHGIGVLSSTDMEDWDFTVLRWNDFQNEGVYSDADPSVAMNTKGEIMLALRVGESVYIHKSTDPFRTSLGSRYQIPDARIQGSPWIQALGQGQVGLTFRDGGDDTRIAIYTDDTGIWSHAEEYPASKTFRSPTLMPVYSKYTNNPNKGGEGIELRLWFFFFDTSWEDVPWVYGREERYLGELRKVDERKVDWNARAYEMGYTGEDAVRLTENIARVCPLVGVVDLPPPCALNGKTARENESKFTFIYEQSESKTVSHTWKNGAFITTGKLSPVALDVHVGVQGAFGETKTFTTTMKYSYDPSFEPGKIVAFHAVPTTISRKFQAFRDNTEINSVPPVIVLQVVGASIHPVPFDPPKEMPAHQVGDLTTYQARVGGYKNISASGTWISDSDLTVEMKEDNTTSETNGYYLSVKSGGNIPDKITFGYEGSFTWDTKRQTSTSASWALILKNPPWTLSGHVYLFKAILYLLKPTKNPAPYWIPDYVTQGRNAAWLVTYDVPEIKYR